MTVYIKKTYSGYLKKIWNTCFIDIFNSLNSSTTHNCVLRCKRLERCKKKDRNGDIEIEKTHRERERRNKGMIKKMENRRDEGECENNTSQTQDMVMIVDERW